MIKLIYLSFSGIGRFVEEQHIDFSTKEKILQVDGKNENTGGSSGSGKSTIFHALDYLLGISEIPATTLQSRLTKTSIAVKGGFEIDGKKVILSRSKKDGLTIDVDGEVTSGNVKAAEELLDNLIGISKKIFKKMVHKKQKEGGFFLALTAKESYEFLTKALGLESLTSRILLIDQDIKKNKENLIGLEKHLSILESGIESSNKDLESFALPENPSQETISDVERALSDSDSRIANFQLCLKMESEELDLKKPTKGTIDTSNLTSLLTSLEADKTKLEKDKKLSISGLESSRDQLKSLIRETELTLSKIPFFRQNIDKVVSDIKSRMEQKSHIEKAQCPTCMQSWAGESAQSKIQSIQESIDKLKNEALALKIQIEKEPELKTTLSGRQNVLTDTENEIKKMESEYNVLINDIVNAISEIRSKLLNLDKELNNEYSEKLNLFNTDKINLTIKFNSIISAEKDVRNNIKSNLDSLKNKKDLYDNSVKMRVVLLSKMSKQNNDRNNVENDIKSVDQKILVAEESKRLIKSYSLQKFQETLDSIGETASDILRNVPNMATASIHFEGCKETGSGSIKEEVTALINMDGEADIDIKSLSGGEETAINLAVDLAVIDVLEIKAGKGADFFILDEPFEGLDSISREAVVDILKGIDSNKRIIIVDHGAETKEIISDKIIAVRNGELSYVV